MRSRPAEIKPLRGRSISRPSQQRAEGESRTQCVLTMKDMPPTEAAPALQCERSQHVTMNNQIAESRNVCGKRLNDNRTEFIPALVPITILESIRRVLNMNGHDMRP